MDKGFPEIAYHPFGMVSRYSYLGNQNLGYRYSFNGKENDADVKGDGNQQDYGMRIYDPRLGRFLSTDPLTRNYPWFTPYQFASNTPIQATDLDGGEAYWFCLEQLEKGLFGTNKLQQAREGFTDRAVENIKGLAHSFNETLRNLPITTALGGLQYVKTGSGESNVAVRQQILKSNLSLTKVAAAVINDYKDLFSKAAKGDAHALGGVAFEAAMFFVPFEEGPAKGGAELGKITKGFAFFDENTSFRFNTAAKEFEEGTTGAMSNVATKKRFSPGLFFENTITGGKNFVKLDGFEIEDGVLRLIDSKYNATTFPKQIKDLQRVSEALRQNPTFGSLKIEGVIEVPNQKAYNAVERALKKARVENIDIRIRAIR